MKRIFTLILAMVSAAGTLLAQNSGGPDQYGYTWRSSAAANGPAFNWVDITSTGTQVTGLGDDNSVGMFPMGFDFKYYWTDVNQVKIGSNGWISFNNLGNIAHGFPNIPQVNNQANIIAPLLTDLNFSSATGNNPGEVYYYSNNIDTFIVSFINAPFWVNATPDFTGSSTFQVIFSGADSSITFQYQNMNAVIPNLTTFNDLVVGIEDPTETIGLELFKDSIPPSNTAFKFYRPSNSTFQITDIAPTWNDNEDNGAIIEVLGRPFDVTANIANLGNVDVTSNFNVNTQIKRGAGLQAPLYNQNITVGRLAQGADTMVTHNTRYTPVTPPVTGNFKIETRTSLAADLNTTNNLVTTELVVIDTTSGLRQVDLTYNKGTWVPQTNDGIIGFGTAVYFKPPFYPVDVNEVSAFLLQLNTSPTPTHGFSVDIFDDNGPNGMPGTLLYTDTLRPSNIVDFTFNPVVLSNPITITSGGFYVSWVKTDTVQQSVIIGTDGNPPFSNRTFEVQGNSFAPYRSGSVEDVMINATIGNFPAPVGIKDELKKNFSVSQNYPNPAADQTTINLELEKSANVEVVLRNIIGNKVKSYDLGRLQAGENPFTFSTSLLAPGIYFYTVNVDNQSVTKKMVITK